MSDLLNIDQRSYNMSRIKSANTSPELAVRKMLWHQGYRYRLNYKITGRPDITFPKKKIAIFIDGCFWHGCKQHFRIPKSNTSFWINKIEKNIHRDNYVNNELKSMNWIVLRIWEHEIKDDPERILKRLLFSLS